MLGFGLVAREFIVLTIGEVWLTSAGYIQILCFAGAVIPVSTLLTDLIISRGRSDIFLWSTLAFALCQLGTLWTLHHLGYSIRAMVVAYTVLTVAWLFVWHFFVRRLTGYTLLMLLKDVLPFALAAVAVMGVTWLATQGITNLWLLLGCRVVLASILYYIIMRMAGAAILKECINSIRRKKL